MSGHRHYYKRRRSPESSSSGSWTSSWSCSSSSTETDDDVHDGGHRRRLKRSSASLPVCRWQASSFRPSWSWVLLNRAGARPDDFRRDRTTSATSRTSRGDEISVSFELVEPPGTSVLTVDDFPRASTRMISGNVIAAHRDVVLLAITSESDEDTYPPKDVVNDLFVYQANRDRSGRRRPSLLLLPSAGGPWMYRHHLGKAEIGIMSCTSSNDGSSPSFVVAELRKCQQTGTDVRLFRPGSGSGQWESFRNLHVHGANGGRDLRWWTTDAVVPYRRRYMIWVDYYRGMVLMDLSSSQSSEPTRNTPPPRLRYVPLPVDRVGDPGHTEFGSRGYPLACRSVCATRYGVKFVSVDTQHWSSFGVGHRDVLKWSHRFRITTWSLQEDDDFTWRKDVTMHEEEFWEAFDSGDRFPFPHVQPRFPVFDVDNPDIVVFRLEEPDDCHDGYSTWMIEVDLRKKVLLAATAYSNKRGSDGLSSDDDDEIIDSARKESFDLIPSELPRYLDLVGGQACKKRRQ